MERLVRVVAGFTVMVVLVACTPAPAPELPAPSVTSSPSEDADRADLGPLDAYLHVSGGTDPADHQAGWLRRETLVAECMAEHGFEYLPQTISVQELAPDEPDYGTREFAERYGYGVFRQPRYVTAGSGPEDANADIKAAMSLAERAEYDRALYGTGEGGYYETGDEVDLEANGCTGVGIDFSLNGDGKDDPVLIDASRHSRYIDEKLVGEDPRVAAADAQWAACMADAGWPGLTSQPEAQLHAAGWHLTLIDPATSVATAPDAQMLDDEIALALADLDCTTELELEELRLRVRAELQQEYVDEHRDELDAWLRTRGP